MICPEEVSVRFARVTGGFGDLTREAPNCYSSRCDALSRESPGVFVRFVSFVFKPTSLQFREALGGEGALAGFAGEDGVGEAFEVFGGR